MSITTHAGNSEDRYLELVRQCPLRPIRSDGELDGAVRMVDTLLSQPSLRTEEQDYLEVLSDIVDRYEAKEVPIAPVSDAAMLKHLIDARGITAQEVAKGTGIVNSTISAVLNEKRTLNREHIGRLAKFFHVSPNVFAF